MAETQGPLLNSVAIAFGVITFIAISLRLWSRFFIVQSVGSDDWLICVAALLSWAFIGCTLAAVQHGMGQHYEAFDKLGTENKIAYFQIVWLSSIFYNACLGFIKISVLALYKRLGDARLTKLSMIMIGVICCQAGGNVLACIFQCAPVQAAYDVTILPEDKKCININAFYLANAAVNILTDVMTYTLPIPLIIKIQLPRRQKIGLGVILSLGLFACVSSIVRITYVPPMLTSSDATWVISGAMYWSVIETNIGILASSIPSFKTIATRYAPKLLGSSHKSGSKRSGFKMMNMGSSGKPGYAGGTINEHGVAKSRMETTVGRGFSGENSEEDLVDYTGHIKVTTEITHTGDDLGRRE
ncbi:uncharacterized protein J7T54_004611 [Emericellopsis cladophorae]|uniref:Rhodopsin domain-containing protein n=1 Tax=Emericellopsis cladophorae TaxID=2686198 RepID=A0A9P9Y6Q8_9HYPO|nr:uncharacterized protein J7T54_004611 [Emericellopsis cladophorae]KAI6784065.1 hypothetical protein J7T54_004611 [Emericellopsis cladophorae]